MLGVAAVVAFGVGGRLGDEDPRASPVVTPPHAAVTTPAPASSGSVVALSEPAPPPASVAGIPLWVRGRVTAGADELLLVLRSERGEVARQTTRPGRNGRFAAVFTLQPPRPAMDITVVVTALDERDGTLGEAEQVVHVQRLDRVAAAPSPRPSLGEDGVLGSRGVAVSELESGRDGAPAAAGVAGWPWPGAGGLAEQAYR